MLVVQASDLPYLPQAGRLHHNRYCWRNPPCPSFVKGGDPKAPFGKGGRAERGGFCRIAVEEKTFANSVTIGERSTDLCAALYSLVLLFRCASMSFFSSSGVSFGRSIVNPSELVWDLCLAWLTVL